MGFYIRKSFRVGPVRFNLSKSGIGTSVGVKGFRLGTGPRGSYVHMGREGLYYRKSLGGGRHRGARSRSAGTAERPDAGPLTVYDSATVTDLADEDSAALVAEMNERSRRTPWLPVLSGVGAGICATTALVGLTASGTPHAMRTGLFLGAASAALAIACLLAFPLTLIHFEQQRTTALLFDLEGPAHDAARRLHEAILGLGRCDALWHVLGTRPGTDDKYDQGATHRVVRERVRPREAEPPHVRTNVSVAMLPAGRQQLYFLPDRLLVLEAARYAAIAWGHLRVEAGTTTLVEDGPVPADARQVDATWLHPNKDGSPDHRFKDNPRLPEVEYGTLALRSDTGLDELFYTSRADAAAGAARAIEAISAAAGA